VSPRTPWGPFEALAATAAVVLLARLVALSVVLLAAASFERIGADRTTLTLLGTCTQHAVMIAAVLWLAGWRGGRPVEVLALGPPRGGARAYVVPFLVLIASVVVMGVAIRAVDADLLRQDLRPFTEMLASPAGWLVFPMVGIGAPLAEELLFRGFLFTALAQSRLGVVGASVVTAVGWAAIHTYSPVGLAQVLVIGLVLSWMLVRSGSLRVPILVHALYNTVLAALMAAEIGKGVLTP
jgi:hypothetical protein